MKVEELEAQFRQDIRDTKKPYLFTPADFLRFINEAELEAALRADLLYEEDDPAYCTIPVTAPSAIYELHRSVTRVAYATFTPEGSDQPCRLELIDRVKLTQRRPTWRERTEAPRELIVMDRKVRFGCIPEASGVLQMEVYRSPRERMQRPEDCPEVAEQHHMAMNQWCLYRGYQRPDVETYDKEAAQRALGEFERVFGMRPDAEMGKDFENTPHVNTCHF